MLATASRFFVSPEVKPEPKPPLTRVEQLDQFKPTLILIEKLRTKNKELSDDAKTHGIISIDYTKSVIVSSLLKQLDEKITEFNEKKPTEEDQEILKLAQDLSEAITNTTRTYYDTINKQRNNRLTVASDAIDTLPYFAAATAAGIFSGGFLFTGLTFVSTAALSDSTKKNYGISKEKTATSILLKNLTDTLDKTIKSLRLVIALTDQEIVHPPQFTCPIYLTLMKDPVTCRLDGNSYERVAIVEWLTAHRTSPSNRNAMTEDEEVEQVIAENRNLKELIEKYIQDHPEYIAAEEAEPRVAPDEVDAGDEVQVRRHHFA